MMVFYISLLIILQFVIVHTAPLLTGIPTTEDQVNLLINVQEIFEELKTLLDAETNATETSIITDVKKIVHRAKDHLSLVEELAMSKLSNSDISNSVTIFDIKPEINKLTIFGYERLNECIINTINETKENTRKIEDVSERAFNSGQLLLDSLSTCTKKTAFNLLSCYKDIIQHDVFPVKKLMSSAIKAHKDGHLKYIKLRNKANECVDDIMEEHDIKIAYILNKYILNDKS